MNYSNIKNKNKNINLGIQLLRTILCFWVLSFHYLKEEKLNYFFFYIIKRRFFHVPCFSFISFYYSYNIFSQSNMTKIKNRLKRLLIPYIIWPLIVYIKNIPFTKNLSFYPLKMQLLLGRQFMTPHWYLFSITIITIFIYILSNLIKTDFLFYAQLLMILIYIGQYSNYYLFLNIYKPNVKFPILDTLSIFPLCVTGLTMASINIFQLCKKYKTKVIFFSFIFLYFLFKYKCFIDLGGYNGIMNIFASFFFFSIFYLLPLENINTNFQRIIKHITNFTQGVYCLQSIMNPFVNKIFNIHGTLKSIIITYFISYLISFIGFQIFGKTNLKYLFI